MILANVWWISHRKNVKPSPYLGLTYFTFAAVSIALCLFSIQVLFVILNIAGWRLPCDLEIPSLSAQ